MRTVDDRQRFSAGRRVDGRNVLWADTADEHEIPPSRRALSPRRLAMGRTKAQRLRTAGDPKADFKVSWEGYDEALLLYILGLGSPTLPLPESSYSAWASTYRWEHWYGYEYLYAGPLFTHQLSHMWVDFRGIQDAFMREKGIDYFENSRRATYVQQQYAIDNHSSSRTMAGIAGG